MMLAAEGGSKRKRSVIILVRFPNDTLALRHAEAENCSTLNHVMDSDSFGGSEYVKELKFEEFGNKEFAPEVTEKLLPILLCKEDNKYYMERLLKLCAKYEVCEVATVLVDVIEIAHFLGADIVLRRILDFMIGEVSPSIGVSINNDSVDLAVYETYKLVAKRLDLSQVLYAMFAASYSQLQEKCSVLGRHHGATDLSAEQLEELVHAELHYRLHCRLEKVEFADVPYQQASGEVCNPGHVDYLHRPDSCSRKPMQEWVNRYLLSKERMVPKDAYNTNVSVWANCESLDCAYISRPHKAISSILQHKTHAELQHLLLHYITEPHFSVKSQPPGPNGGFTQSYTPGASPNPAAAPSYAPTSPGHYSL